MERKTTLALMAAACLAASSNAYAISGNDLIKWLPDYEQRSNFSSGMFLGYVSGVGELGANILFCLKPSVTRGQAAAIVAKYLRNHPESWQEEASTLVVAALEESFPCPKSAAKK